MSAPIRKKLIEVALPLEAINKAAAYEKMPGIGPHPRGLHLWWARRPLAAARSVIFAQMIDDPSSRPELFPTEADQQRERQRLFALIEKLVLWENTTNQDILKEARHEIQENWRRTCTDHAADPQAATRYNPEKLPDFHDPFAGGGALPLEAQRLGLESYASDLNPVAVLINKAMIEIPPKFAGRSPVNPDSRKGKMATDTWHGSQGLADDLRYYGQWMRDEAQKRIGHLYPPAAITDALVQERPDLSPLLGEKLPVIAWLWARTVRSPNPALANVEVPLVSSFFLSTKSGKEAYVEPIIDGTNYRFTVKIGKPDNAEVVKNGTKLARANFRCVVSGVPIDGDYIKAEGMAGRMGDRLMAVVAEGPRGRIYLPPTPEMESVARQAKPEWKPAGDVPARLTGGTCVPYGLTTWGDLFTPRQLVALTTFSDLIGEAYKRICHDAITAGIADDTNTLSNGGIGATAYAEAVSVYLAFAVDRCADFSNTCTRWVSGNQKVMNLFGKQAIAMTWDFPEAAILHETVGGFAPATKFISECILKLSQAGIATVSQQNAMANTLSELKVISTDPPYYDNIGYADLSDFFYVWLRRSLAKIFPPLFSTLSVPKLEELVATPYRHKSKNDAEEFFLNGMTAVMQCLAQQANQNFPITIYYAFKQSEKEGIDGTASTGWETFLGAVIQAGLSVTGTWPMRSEQEHRMIGIGANALASSIVLVCRARPLNAPIATRREFITALQRELPPALRGLQSGNIAPVDMAQAAIGPGMAVYTRYTRVVDTEDKPIPVREALVLINQILDEALAEQESEFDADTRWALAWFEQYGFGEGPYGTAETLATAKNTSINGLISAGILHAKSGKARLLSPAELPGDWNPATDIRLTVWEITHHLVRLYHVESAGDTATAALLRQIGSRADLARDLAYRLYALAERGKRSADAQGYNALVLGWPELARLAREKPASTKPDYGELNLGL